MVGLKERKRKKGRKKERKKERKKKKEKRKDNFESFVFDFEISVLRY
jgi:hypothetical protein